MKIITTLIRLVLTTLLLVGVYHETGKWTTITLALMTIAHEVDAVLWKIQNQ